jgi:hypothetical protein
MRYGTITSNLAGNGGKLFVLHKKNRKRLYAAGFVLLH